MAIKNDKIKVNNSTNKSKLFKVRVYALFQLSSLSGITLILLSITMTGYKITESGTKISGIEDWLASFARLIINEKNTAISITGSVLFWLATIAILISWIVGFFILKVKTRNLYDSLFILFVPIPFISNIICFMAQISDRYILYKDKPIDFKKEVKKELEELEKTRILEIKTIHKKREDLKKRKKQKRQEMISKVKNKTTKINVLKKKNKK